MLLGNVKSATLRVGLEQSLPYVIILTDQTMREVFAANAIIITITVISEVVLKGWWWQRLKGQGRSWLFLLILVQKK